MRTLFASATLVAVLGMTSSASAESARVAALRVGIHDIDTRSAAVRKRVERSPPPIRRESQRLVDAVDGGRVALANRLAILDLLGASAVEEEQPLEEMERTVKACDRLLTIVERWYEIR